MSSEYTASSRRFSWIVVFQSLRRLCRERNHYVPLSPCPVLLFHDTSGVSNQILLLHSSTSHISILFPIKFLELREIREAQCIYLVNTFQGILLADYFSEEQDRGFLATMIIFRSRLPLYILSVRCSTFRILVFLSSLVFEVWISHLIPGPDIRSLSRTEQFEWLSSEPLAV